MKNNSLTAILGVWVMVMIIVALSAKDWGTEGRWATVVLAGVAIIGASIASSVIATAGRGDDQDVYIEVDNDGDELADYDTEDEPDDGPADELADRRERRDSVSDDPWGGRSG